MENFLRLLKKQLLNEISSAEKEELIQLTQDNEAFAAVYEQVCLNRSFLKEGDRKEAEAAYERHVKRMQQLKMI